MTGNQHVCLSWIGICLALALATPASAAVEVGASLDRPACRVGEQVVLTVNLEGEARSVSPPRLPDLDSIDVYSGGESRSMSFVNGEVSATYGFTYYLRPRRVGAFEIPPIELEVDGAVYRTVPLELTVLASNQTPPPSNRSTPEPPAQGSDGNEDYFVRMTVDQDTVVVGQQVILTFAFYRSTHANLFDSPEYTPPTTEGFWREDIPPERHSSKVLNGRLFRVTEISYALFPTRAGDLEIGEAVVRIPGDSFPSFFRRRNRRGDVFLRAPAIGVHVRSFPPGAPAAFDGTVASDLVLRAAVDRDELAVGEAVTLSITLEGDGYLASAKRPDPGDIEGFRVHDDGGGMDSRPLGGKIHGKLSVDKLLIAQQEGAQTIPALRYAYYDTRRQDYVTLSTRPIALNVTAAEGQVSSVFTGGARSEIELLGRDILHIRPITGALKPYRGPLPRQLVFWAVLAVPALAWASSGLVARRRRQLLSDPDRLRASRALRASLRRLQETDAPEIRVAEALRGYVADKTGRNAAGLTVPEIEQWLKSRQVDGGVAQAILRLLDRCDHARFAGGMGDVEPLVRETQSTLEALERELQGGR